MELSEALKALGTTKDEVATTLRAKGCKGKRMSARSCPIHTYLTVIGFKEPLVAKTYASVHDEDEMRRAHIDLPKPVIQFIDAFDHGKYPELKERK